MKKHSIIEDTNDRGIYTFYMSIFLVLVWVILKTGFANLDDLGQDSSVVYAVFPSWEFAGDSNSLCKLPLMIRIRVEEFDDWAISGAVYCNIMCRSLGYW